MASLALRSARPWRAMGMRDRPAGCASCAARLCGALWGSGRPPRGGRRRSFVGGESGDAGGAENRRRAPACATSVATRSAGWAALRPFRFRFIPRRATAQQRATNNATATRRTRPTRRHTATSATGHCAAAGDQHATRRHSPPHGDIGVVLDGGCCCAGRAARPNPPGRQSMALNDQQKRGGVYLYGADFSRARARARRWRRELGGGVRQHPGSTTALRGLMASLALRSARPWRAMGMRDRPAGCASCATRLCGALWGSGRPPRGGRRRSFVGGESGDAGGAENRRRAPACATSVATRSAGGRRFAHRFRFIPRRATAQQRATNTTLAATALAAIAHTATSRRATAQQRATNSDTRRHTATSMSS